MVILPYFYIKAFDALQPSMVLDEDNSRHAVQVLRMKTGQELHLTDGCGHLITARITNDHKRHCEVTVVEVEARPPRQPELTIAIAPTKNSSRFEWFLEKAAELGVHRVVPLISKRTEKQKFKAERLQNILISALLQSQQTWLLQLEAPVSFDALMAPSGYAAIPNKYIAHCVDGNKHKLGVPQTATIVLIGPEGDFTHQEIEAAVATGYQPVSLGATRLRTETAGIVAATLLSV